MTRRELTTAEREVLSRAAKIGNLERAGQPSYSGTKATETMRSAAWASWLEKAGNDPIKANRLRSAALMRGREKARRNKKGQAA